MSEISSGLVAVAWVPDDAIAKLRSGEPKIVLTGVPMLKYEGVNTSGIVVLSDAEAIIAQKDAEILEQCRINGMGAEREATLLGKVERQSAALKLAREALIGALSDDQPYINASKEALAAINEVIGE